MKESNVSNLTKALAVVSLLAPVNALPLGIGEIQLHSALNQHLNAEIRLTVDPNENPSDVSVRLAPPEKFDQAGVVWNYFLSKIKFEPMVQANGSIIVKITSREVLTEPFLDFLLEVTWPQGSMTREFTLLIDPPAAYNQATIPIVQAPDYSAEAIEPPVRPAKKTRPAPRRAVRAEPSDSVSQPIATEGEFGPVQKTDTLWSIATQLGQERNVPTPQMLNALHRANPDAFNNGNINSLKEGALLKIPSLASAQQPLPSETKQPTAKTAKGEPTTTEKPAKPLELVAPSEAKLVENTVVGGKAKSGVHSTAAAAKTESAAETSGEGKDLELQARIEKLEQQLNMMQQLLALKDQQLATLQNNKQAPAQAETAPAPAQPTTPPVLPPATTEQPSQTQTQAPAEPAPAAQQPAVQPIPAPAPKPVAKVAPPPAPAPAPEEEGLFSSDAYYWVVGGLGFGILGLLGWLLWRKRHIDERINTESMFASASQIQMPDSESSLSVPIMDINNTSEYDVGTVGESSFISDFTPSDFDAFDTDQNEVDPISEADVYLAYGRYQQAEELIRHAIQEQPHRDECKLKLLEIFYASENKDAFCDYAQELANAGKQADKPFWKKIADMAKEIAPDSPLFGIDSATSNTNTKVASESFELSAATTLGEADTDGLEDDSVFALLDDDLAALDLDLDKNLEPDDNGLDFDLGDFDSNAKTKTPNLGSVSGDKPANAGRDEPAATESSDIEAFDFNLDFAEPAADDKTQVVSTSDDLDLALETIEFSSVADDIAAVKAESPSVEDNSIESFDFNFDLEPPKPAASGNEDEATAAEQPAADLESFDFADFGTTDAKPEAPAEKPTDIESFDFNFDLDLAAPDLASASNTTDAPLNLESELKLETFDFSDFDNLNAKAGQATDNAKPDTVDDFNFEFDFDAPIISTSSDDKFEVGVSDLTDMDEYETKIDLAKAYIDMGDIDAAKTIAEDVLAKGSKQQQQAAQALLDELK